MERSSYDINVFARAIAFITYFTRILLWVCNAMITHIERIYQRQAIFWVCGVVKIIHKSNIEMRDRSSIALQNVLNEKSIA